MLASTSASSSSRGRGVRSDPASSDDPSISELTHTPSRSVRERSATPFILKGKRQQRFPSTRAFTALKEKLRKAFVKKRMPGKASFGPLPKPNSTKANGGVREEIFSVPEEVDSDGENIVEEDDLASEKLEEEETPTAAAAVSDDVIQELLHRNDTLVAQNEKLAAQYAELAATLAQLRVESVEPKRKVPRREADALLMTPLQRREVERSVKGSVIEDEEFEMRDEDSEGDGVANSGNSVLLSKKQSDEYKRLRDLKRPRFEPGIKGKGRNYSVWKLGILSAFMMMGVTDSRVQYCYVFDNLDLNVQTYVQQRVDAASPNIDELWRVLDARYLTGTSDLVYLQANLHSVKQPGPGETWPEFISEVLRKCDVIGYSNDACIVCVREKIPASLNHEPQLAHTKNAAELLNVVQYIDEGGGFRKEWVPRTPNGYLTSSDGRTVNPQLSRSIATRQLPTGARGYPENRSLNRYASFGGRDGQMRVCFVCGKPGHMARECLSKGLDSGASGSRGRAMVNTATRGSADSGRQ